MVHLFYLQNKTNQTCFSRLTEIISSKERNIRKRFVNLEELYNYLAKSKAGYKKQSRLPTGLNHSAIERQGREMAGITMTSESRTVVPQKTGCKKIILEILFIYVFI